MKHTQNYKRFLIATARMHLAKARIARAMAAGWPGFDEQWDKHMNYARQARRMAGVL